MKLTEALKTKNTFTENGMSTNSTSLNYNVDLFFKAGAMRVANEADIIALVSKAWSENPTICLKILFWSRDVRFGAGERRFFRIAIKYLADKDPIGFQKLLALIPKYGRWDDLTIFKGTQSEKFVLNYIKSSLDNKDGLCAKWMPRKGDFSITLRNHLKLSPKEYRKLLVKLTKVVETQMCSNDWDNINYEHVPSLAMSRYGKSFAKHSPNKFSDYVKNLKNGTAKINVNAVYPYDIIKSLYHNTAAEEQWNSLPNYLEGNTERILPVVDVSGSMSAKAGGSLTCMDVAISLGLYISERNEGHFKDHFITFSEKPNLQHLIGNLKSRFQQMRRADWGMNTNLEAVFKLILTQAKLHNISEDEMPTQILILSDMEFDAATGSYKSLSFRYTDEQPKWNPTSHEMIKKMFFDSGYKMPNIIYWNIESRNNNVPVRFDENGTALISGFSPSIMTSLLKGSDLTPASVMLNTVDKERYDEIKYDN